MIRLKSVSTLRPGFAGLRLDRVGAGAVRHAGTDRHRGAPRRHVRRARAWRALVRDVGGYPYRSNDWIELNANLFRWMKLEKTVMFLILALIVLVAAFNIVSTLLHGGHGEAPRHRRAARAWAPAAATSVRIFLWPRACASAAIGTGLGALLGLAAAGARALPLRRHPGRRLLPLDAAGARRGGGRRRSSVARDARCLCLAAAVYPAWCGLAAHAGRSRCAKA